MVTIGDRELAGRELALVNAHLLLRDLSLRPQRLEERQVEHAPPKGDTPPLRTVGSARPDLTDARRGETRESPESRAVQRVWELQAGACTA